MFLRRTCRPLSRPLTRLNSTVSVAAPAEESPRPSFFTRQTIYPFLLLSLLTSLALNLSHGRAQHIEASAVLRAQISVLTTLKARLLAAASSSPRKLSHEDRERVERELEMVGLGKAKGRTTKDDREEGTSWKEVFLGKKGNGFTTDRMDNEGVRGQEEEEFDWAKCAYPVLYFL